MTVKKKAIHISVLLIGCSLLIALACFPGSESGACAILYTLATGVFGSGFAALWIFIYEYNREKQLLLGEIFVRFYDVMENNTLFPLSRFGFYEPGMEQAMAGRHYVSPMESGAVAAMDTQEKCHYAMCRFVDGMLDIGLERIHRACELVGQLDLWSDSFRKKKLQDVIRERLSMPLYSTFLSAPAMEEGYLFRCFSGFKYSYSYSAEEIYPLVAALDKALFQHGALADQPWPGNLDLRGYMHEQLWIFRDAFCKSELEKPRRKMARAAFLKGTEYPYIR